MKKIDEKYYIEQKKIQNFFKIEDYLSVISKCKRLISTYGETIELNHYIGMAYEFFLDNENALIYFKKILKYNPGYIPALNNLANIYKKQNQFKLAEESYLRIIQKEPKYINAYVNFANLKRDLNDFTKSISLYKLALEINNNIPLIHYNISQTYLNIGNFDLAIKHADKTLELDNNFTRADRLKSACTKYEANNSHLKDMENKLNITTLNDLQKLHIFFALGKAYEDIKDYKKSFYFVQQGNNICKNNNKYDITNDIALFSSIKENFTNINYQNFETLNSDITIIFIVGMPRSGTTLTEQILSSDDNIYGAGELDLLPKIIKENFIKDEILWKKIDFEKLSDFKINELRNQYMDGLKNYNIKEKIIIDKAPLNFRWIGLIKILFPNSKVIHCKRDPKDNCLSIYKNFFESSLEWSYDQKDLGTFYNIYLDLIKFWKNQLSDFIYDLNYENLINNFEDEAKKLVNFCNLNWSKQFLNHHKNNNPIKTVSVAQARQPIYRSSMKSSDKFNLYLSDLFSILNKKK